MQFPACVSFLLVLILLYIHLYSSTLFCVFFCPQGGFQSLIGPNEKTASSLHCCSKIIFQGIVFYVTAGHFWLTTLLSMYLSSLLLFLQPKDPFKARKTPDKRTLFRRSLTAGFSLKLGPFHMHKDFVLLSNTIHCLWPTPRFGQRTSSLCESHVLGMWLMPSLVTIEAGSRKYYNN